MQELELYLWTEGKSKGHISGYSPEDARHQLAKKGIHASSIEPLGEVQPIQAYAICIGT